MLSALVTRSGTADLTLNSYRGAGGTTYVWSRTMHPAVGATYLLHLNSVNLYVAKQYAYRLAVTLRCLANYP